LPANGREVNASTTKSEVGMRPTMAPATGFVERGDG
jgi:hypothetical protein